MGIREVIFRGKRIDNGVWVYGQYAYLLNARAKDGEPIEHMILDGTPFGLTVDPTTIGQSTGLTDKNGVKIFEGDIVLLTYMSKGGTETERVEVRYHTTWLKWVITNDKDEPGYYFEDFGECDTSRIEVIGNIHDNPELLEGE